MFDCAITPKSSNLSKQYTRIIVLFFVCICSACSGQAFPPANALISITDLPAGFYLEAGPGHIPGDGETGDYSTISFRINTPSRNGFEQSVYNYGTVFEAKRLFAARYPTSTEWVAWMDVGAAKNADEQGMVCRTSTSYEGEDCEFRARYREYVVYIHSGIQSQVLTRDEFQRVVRVMDLKIKTLIDAHP